MNKFRDFFNKKKANRNFRNSGPGVRLSGEPTSSQPPEASSGAKLDRSAAADVAAAAALKRMQKNEPNQQDAHKKKIQMLVKRQREEEEMQKQMEGINVSSSSSSQPPRDQEFEHSSAISRVLFSSELLGEHHVRSKPELLDDIKTFLNEQICEADDENDKIIAAVLMLYSLNKRDAKELAIKTITAYCQNILTHPGDPKFTSIRLTNKAFQERVAATIGGREFLEAVGFTYRRDGEGVEFLTFSRQDDAHLVEALSALNEGQAVPIKVARNRELFRLKEGQKPKAPKLSNDFYNLSTAELKAEQKNRENELEKLMTLRTKDMRMKDEQLTNYRYKYTLIRVRLPGNVMVQGVFGCYEPFSEVRLFVSSTLSASLAASEFNLKDAGQQLLDDESATLAQLGLAPAALLHLTFIGNAEFEDSIVADEYVEHIQELD